MGTLIVPIADDAVRLLQNAAREKRCKVEELVQDLAEQYAREAKQRSLRFEEAAIEVDRRLAMGDT